MIIGSASMFSSWGRNRTVPSGWDGESERYKMKKGRVTGPGIWGQVERWEKRGTRGYIIFHTKGSRSSKTQA